MTKEKKEKHDKEKPDYKEVRPPIDTGGLSFDEVLKKLSEVDPDDVKSLEDNDKDG